MKKFLFALLFIASATHAHEMVPTYPEWKQGLYPGVLRTTIEIFNKRKDVEYYEIGVFDKNWNPVYFVADYKIIQLRYLSSASIDVYISKDNRDRVEYICSRSRLRKEEQSKTAISSKICSKVKK